MNSQPFRQSVIFGAGALGSWLGARLDPPALLVARGEHAVAMRADGLPLGSTVARATACGLACKRVVNASSSHCFRIGTGSEGSGSTLSQVSSSVSVRLGVVISTS